MLDVIAQVAIAPAADVSASWRPDVGSRVRVAIRHGRSCSNCPHFSGESGRLGRIVKVREMIGAPSHPFLVVLDRDPAMDAVLDWRMAILARHYAADELEPLDA
jgi:hypothetical protein